MGCVATRYPNSLYSEISSTSDWRKPSLSRLPSERSAPGYPGAEFLLSSIPPCALRGVPPIGLLAMQEIRCALRMGGGRENSAFVAFQNCEPALDIGGVFGARFGSQGKIGTKESGAKFSHQFLAGIG